MISASLCLFLHCCFSVPFLALTYRKQFPIFFISDRKDSVLTVPEDVCTIAKHHRSLYITSIVRKIQHNYSCAEFSACTSTHQIWRTQVLGRVAHHKDFFCCLAYIPTLHILSYPNSFSQLRPWG